MILRVTLFLSLLLLLVACAIPVKTEVEEVSIPAPVSEKLPVTIGILYSDQFKTHKHIQKVITPGSGLRNEWTADIDLSIGPASISLFDQLATSMFSNIIYINSNNSENLGTTNVDAILEPSMGNIHYGAAVYSGLKWSFGGLNLVYNIRLYLPNGDEILSWAIQSNAPPVIKIRTIFDMDNAALDLFEIAVRETAAQFYSEFPKLPEIIRWLETLE